MDPVSHIIGPYWQGAYNAREYLPHKATLHIHCAYEIPAQGPYAERELWLKLDDTDVYWSGDPAWREAVLHHAVEAAVEARRGGVVLTTCHMGLNRSGLITALALILGQGLTARQAIHLIRSKRNESCLSNKTFEQYVIAVGKRMPLLEK